MASSKTPRAFVLACAAVAALPWAQLNAAPTKPQIAFASARHGAWEIYVMAVDGANQRNLTRDPAQDMAPAWSPDGEKIAFESSRSGDFQLYLMNVDGSEQELLASVPADSYAGARGAAFSPDGRALAFWSRGQIFVASAAECLVRQVTHHEGWSGGPTWAPDGQTLAFGYDTDDERQIRTLSPDGSDLRIYRTRVNSGLDWSPDGARFLASGDVSGGTSRLSQIWAPPAPEGELLRSSVFGMTRRNHSPTWSPDGTQIAWVHEPNISVMDADNSNKVRITDTAPAFNSDPDWFDPAYATAPAAILDCPLPLLLASRRRVQVSPRGQKAVAWARLRRDAMAGAAR